MTKRNLRTLRNSLLAILAAGALAFAVGSPAQAAPSLRAEATPDGAGPCNSGTVNWAAIYPTYGDYLLGINASRCIGDKGTWTLAANSSQVFCAGNNNGTFWWHDTTTGTSGSANFTDDHSYSVFSGKVTGAQPGGDKISVYQVKITSWTGSAGC
jgi:hypothetical protein